MKERNLLIVESPAKAKTIEKILGKDFHVVSCYGHIADLVKKGMGINIENNFEPVYEISEDKTKVVRELKTKAKKAEMVWLASDEDREGEAIAWHLFNYLGLTHKNTRRIVFNEITSQAIKNALQNHRSIDYNLVNAQQARRVLDRIVGFELSPVLWRKVKGGLSAGRVQSAALRLLVERERSVLSFEPTSTYRTLATFSTEKNERFSAELNTKFEQKEDTRSYLESISGASFSVESVDKRPAKRTPSAPHTTSTLQQDAAQSLGYPVAYTMSLAQKLYEAGHITYMRTDSVNLSNEALGNIKEMVSTHYGPTYHKQRKYTSKVKNAQEAHEAIRPTSFSKLMAGSDDSQKKLYQLIWRRTMASQMSDAQLESTTVKIGNDKAEHLFVAKGEILVFDGFLKVYEQAAGGSAIKDKLLPKLNEGDKLTYDTIEATEKYNRPTARYTEASLVKKLEELEIGRPSTYVATISTIIKRKYADKRDLEGNERKINIFTLDSGSGVEHSTKNEVYGADKNKLIPTDVGKVVNDFLVKNFERVLDYQFTARVEENFDMIARGETQWTELLTDFYKDFHPEVEYVTEHSEREAGDRVVGVDPKTGKNVIARVGRYGPMVQLGETPEDPKAPKPKMAGLRPTQTIETLTLGEALKLFELPRDLGTYEDKKVVASIGRFGPYIRHDSKFVSVKKTDGDDIYEIELDRAIELIEAKRKADKEKYINSFQHGETLIEVLNGRWGPYIKMEKKNYKIPKDVDAKKLSLEDCIKIIESPPPSKSRKRVATKKPATKPAARVRKTS